MLVGNSFFGALGYFTLGPRWQMWAFMSFAAISCFAWMLFPTVWAKRWVHFVFVAFTVVVVIYGGIAFAQKTRPPLVSQVLTSNPIAGPIAIKDGSGNMLVGGGNGNAIISGGVFNGNYQIGGVSNTLIVNPKPAPSIWGTQMQSQGIDTNGIWTTEIISHVKDPPRQFHVMPHLPVGTTVIDKGINPPEMIFGGNDMGIKVCMFWCKLKSTNKISLDDIQFSVLP